MGSTHGSQCRNAACKFTRSVDTSSCIYVFQWVALLVSVAAQYVGKRTNTAVDIMPRVHEVVHMGICSSRVQKTAGGGDHVIFLAYVRPPWRLVTVPGARAF